MYDPSLIFVSLLVAVVGFWQLAKLDREEQDEINELEDQAESAEAELAQMTDEYLKIEQAQRYVNFMRLTDRL